MRLVPSTIVVMAVTLVVSCSSQAPAPAPPTSSQVTSGHGAYAACLAENGVPTPPAGPGAPPGVDEQTWATAREACADEAPGPAG
jgi:hypothetical protein